MVNNNTYNNLFYKVWKNSYIKSIIFKHLKLYNIFYGARTMEHIFSSGNNAYKYKDYLYQLEMDRYSDFKDIPYNIESILYTDIELLEPSLPQFPSWIKKLEIWDINLDLRSLSNLSSLETLEIYYSDLEDYQEITSSSLPSTITDLTLNCYKYGIKKSALPKRLVKLSIILIEMVLSTSSDESSNESSEDIYSSKDYYFEITSESLPESLKEFIFISDTISIDLERLQFPKSLTVLMIGSENPYSIPSNIQFPTLLKKLEINCIDFHFKLPDQLKELKLICSNNLKSNLPESLDHLQLTLLNNNQKAPSLPNSLVSLVLDIENIYDENGISILPSSLKSLLFTYHSDNGFNQELKPFTFPNSLTYLNFNSNSIKCTYNNNGRSLLDNIFPQSLSHLDFGSKFNQSFSINTLPVSLKNLIFGQSFNKEIKPELLPPGLETIEIQNPRYDYQIYSNSPNTIIKCQKDLALNNKANLEYLDLSSINGSEKVLLSSNNSIKTLVIGGSVIGPINLENFKQLETLIVYSNVAIELTTTTTIYENSDGVEESIYNFYNLKEIQVSPKLIGFLDSLNDIFYQFIILK